jgi:uncharacterized protein with ATP-grasp and redox domains
MHWVYERVWPHCGDRDGVRIAKTLLDTIMREVNPGANVGIIASGTVKSVFSTSSPAARHYEALKRESNENAKALLPAAREYIDAGRTPRERFERVCHLAAASNVAPLNSPTGAFSFDEIRSVLDRGSSGPVHIGDDVYGAVRMAKHVLYIADNAGEIGFDSLLIDWMKRMGQGVTLAVKEETFFEDATPADAGFFGLDKVVDGLATVEGFFAPHELPEAAMEAFKACDLVIGKGTGNYEALHGETGGKPTVFMLKVKCGPIARQTDALKGEVVIGMEALPKGGSRNGRTGVRVSRTAKAGNRKG